MLTGFHIHEKQVELFDFFGKKVHSFVFSGNHFQAELPALPKGMYLIHINDGKISNTIKWIKQ
jgi:hypothetical protein